MNLKKLISVLECTVLCGSDGMLAAEVTDVTERSGECTVGSIFVCIEGRQRDGHCFASEAVENGAIAVVCSRGRGAEVREFTASFGEVCIIEVDDTRSAYAKACGEFYAVSRAEVKVICVTGTNGKTTVSSMIRDGLCAYGKRAALLGTLGGSFEGTEYSCGTMTTPDPKRLYGILSDFISRGAEYIVMEASSHALALRKLDGLRICMGVFTNLTPEHLDFHGNMDEYEYAKSLLFRKCEYGGVFLEDDPHAEVMAHSLPEGRRRVRCSLVDVTADYRADNVNFLGEDGVKYAVIHGENRAEDGLSEFRTDVYCGMVGEFSLRNSLLAFATLCELGIPAACASGGITACRGVKGRMEKLPVPKESGIAVFIDFAHTPDALSKLIRSVRGFCGAEKRIVTVFGCGGDRDRSKRSLMGAIASRLADFTVITADNSRSESIEGIINDILSGVDRSRPYKVIPDRREAIEYVLDSSASGDVILLCGKGHEEYELRGGETVPFSEREIVADFFRKRVTNRDEV